MKTLTLILLSSLFCWSCDPKTTSTGHETKITVQLSGEFKDDEAADVSFDGGGTTSISAGQTAYAAVEAGDHTIIATAHILTGTWSHTTHVDAGQSKVINIPCDKATVIVKPDILWLGEINMFYVVTTTSDGTYEFSVAPGAEASRSFRPRKGVVISVYDVSTQKLLTSVTRDFFYQDKFTLTVPYK